MDRRRGSTVPGRKGDFFVARGNGSLHLVGRGGLLEVDPDPVAFPDTLIRIRTSDRLIHPSFLREVWRSFETRRQIERRAKTTAGIYKVSQGDLELIELPIPPIPEQRRIVEAIDSYFTRLDDAVATLERVERNLQRYRAAVLKAAVEGRLVPTEAALAKQERRSYEPASVLLQRILAERRRRWSESGKKGNCQEPPPPGTTSLPDLPEGWCWATVESLSTKVVDGVHKKPRYVNSGIPFVTVRNLTAGPGISFDNLNYITREDYEEYSARTNPERGDLLISKDGTLGVVRAIRTDRVFSIFVSVALIKPVEKAMTDYLELALSSPTVQMQMVPKGSGLQHIHLEDLRQDCIPLAPLAEQRRIVAAAQALLSTADAINTTYDVSLGRLARVRQSILKWAFEGRLANQDRADKSAAALVERMKAKREAASAGNTPRAPSGARKKQVRA